MSKSQTLIDLKKTGLKLSQSEAQEIHSRINEIAQGRHETGEVFAPIEYKEMPQANDVKASTGITPVSEIEAFNKYKQDGVTHISSKKAKK